MTDQCASRGANSGRESFHTAPENLARLTAWVQKVAGDLPERQWLTASLRRGRDDLWAFAGTLGVAIIYGEANLDKGALVEKMMRGEAIELSEGVRIARDLSSDEIREILMLAFVVSGRLSDMDQLEWEIREGYDVAQHVLHLVRERDQLDAVMTVLCKAGATAEAVRLAESLKWLDEGLEAALAPLLRHNNVALFDDEMMWSILPTWWREFVYGP